MYKLLEFSSLKRQTNFVSNYRTINFLKLPKIFSLLVRDCDIREVIMFFIETRTQELKENICTVPARHLMESVPVESI